MSGNVVAPLRRDAAANRTRLVEAAVAVFNDEGLDAGVEQIAQRAGVGVGTLYRRFPTKDALIAHLIEALLRGINCTAQDALAMPDGHGLEHFVRQAADQLAAHRGCLSRLWGYGDAHDLNVLRRRIARLLRDAQTCGVVRSDADPVDITITLWSLRGIIESAKSDAAAACRRHLDIVFDGLRPPCS
jgi:AcrR family transcriptional regulator